MSAIVDDGAAQGAEASLRIRDLGTVELELDGEVRRVPAGRLANALSLLVVWAGRRVSGDALAEAMWGPDAAPRSASTLESHVFRLRRVLEPDRGSRVSSTLLVRDGGGFRLVVGTDQVDSLRFGRLAVDAADLLAHGAPDRALRRTVEALASWRGRPFGAAAEQPWALAAVARLDELHAQVRQTHIGALLATGAVEQGLAELQIALAEQPLRERWWALLMSAYRDTGRRAEALDAYGRARAVLVEELGIEPGPELRQLHAALLTDDPAPPARSLPDPVAGPVHVPTPRHRIIGRSDEIRALTGLLASRSLVTVVGAAGCGKTRLAIAVAQSATADFPDGVWFVDLSSVVADRVLDAVCSAVQLPAPVFGDALSGLRSFLRDRRVLLVLDNCETVLDAAAELVEEVLRDGTESVVLTTSREPLDVADEHVHVLAPLDRASAVELFLERLHATGARHPDPAPDPNTYTEVEVAGQVVAAVDGLPLALELAAGRARAYSLAEIVTQVRLDASSLGHVGRGRPAHHRTVRGAIDSSYLALPAAEAALHRAVSGVSGPFTVELAAALLDRPPGDAADVVAGLVHRSLLSSLGPERAGGPSRFAQLATVRGHGRHQAERLGEDTAARRDAWVERLVRGRPRLGSAAQPAWFRALDDDLVALRATLQHTLVDAPSATGIALAARLSSYWGLRGQVVEGTYWRRTAVQACERDPDLGTPLDRALLFLVLGAVGIMQHRPAEGRRLLRIGMSGCRDVVAAQPDTVGVVCADLSFAADAVQLGQDADMLAELAALVRELATDDPVLDVLARHTQSLVALVTDPTPELAERLVDLHADARAVDDLNTAWAAAAAAAQALLLSSRPVEALDQARAGVAACVDLELRENPYPVEMLACALAARGRHDAAARAFAVAEHHHSRGGMPWPTNDVTVGLLATTAAALDQDRLDGARAAAARLTLADLLAL